MALSYGGFWKTNDSVAPTGLALHLFDTQGVALGYNIGPLWGNESKTSVNLVPFGSGQSYLTEKIRLLDYPFNCALAAGFKNRGSNGKVRGLPVSISFARGCSGLRR